MILSSAPIPPKAGGQKTFLRWVLAFASAYPVRFRQTATRFISKQPIYLFAASLYCEFNAFFFESIVDPVFNQGGKRFPPVLGQQHTLLKN